MAEMSYPTDDMSSTSKTLTSFIDDQWDQHKALFMNNHDSYLALFQAVAKVVPNAGGKVEELITNLHDFYKQYENAYKTLRNLAQAIDTAAQAANDTDQQIGNTFRHTDAKRKDF